MKFTPKYFLLGTLLVTVSSCKTMPNIDQTLFDNPGQSLSVILGGSAGGLVGSQIGSGTGRTLAIVAGTALGAWSGSEIGKYFDSKDRAAFENKSAQTLSSAKDGQSVSWGNSETGNSATMTPKETYNTERKIQYYRSKKVQPVKDIELIGKTYVSLKSANLRSAPSTNSAVIGSLKNGEQFNAMGRTKNVNWIVVSKNNRTIGYVYGTLVKQATNQPAPSLTQSVDLDSIEIEKGINSNANSNQIASIDLDDVVVDVVETNTQCRSMDYTMQAKNGESSTDEFTACQDANGSWEII